jgi:hypothetical protein
VLVILYQGFFSYARAAERRLTQAQYDAQLARELHQFAERINLAPMRRTVDDGTEALVADVRRTADRIAAIAAAGQRF